MAYQKRLRKKLVRKEKRFETEQLMKDKRSEEYEALEQVFDRSTLMTIYDFMNKGVINEIYGSLKAGKESKLYWGKDKEGRVLAIKIFLTVSAEFKKGMIQYIEGDPRFRKVKHDTRSLIYAWTHKEFKNLGEARRVGVRVPEPIEVRNNVLIMEFIGKNGVTAPLLKEIQLSNPQRVYERLIVNVGKLYQNAQLIHGDLSEYNVMIYRGYPVIFDMSQAVSVKHPMADEFLRRDLNNVNYYFQKIGVQVYSAEETYRRVTGKGGSS